MKNRYSNLMWWILGGGVICVILSIPELLIAQTISQNNPETTRTYASIMMIITLLIYITIMAVKSVQFFKYQKEYNQKTLDEAKSQLTSEFKKVLMNNSSAISKEMFDCQAKINEDGKIVCRVHVDFETELDNYEQFLRHFHFVEE